MALQFTWQPFQKNQFYLLTRIKSSNKVWILLQFYCIFLQSQSFTCLCSSVSYYTPQVPLSSDSRNEICCFRVMSVHSSCCCDSHCHWFEGAAQVLTASLCLRFSAASSTADEAKDGIQSPAEHRTFNNLPLSGSIVDVSGAECMTIHGVASLIHYRLLFSLPCVWDSAGLALAKSHVEST